MDINTNAFRIVQEATGLSSKRRRSADPQTLGRTGGLKGGPGRANALSPERRKEIAAKASAARWAQSR